MKLSSRAVVRLGASEYSRERSEPLPTGEESLSAERPSSYVVRCLLGGSKGSPNKSTEEPEGLSIGIISGAGLLLLPRREFLGSLEECMLEKLADYCTMAVVDCKVHERAS